MKSAFAHIDIDSASIGQLIACVSLCCGKMRRQVSLLSLSSAMVGTPAAPFRCVDHTGAVRSLREYTAAGKRVVVWFYPKAITGG